ncbi:MAG: DJ-1/PfpI family protein [Firmicutes bacterium]|nr:DJ-1/PfpI family protein [Bacillota bacterium]MBQ9973256.1 DJ-1/PfpI family protein [Bacillota bacterium]
MVYVFLAEGFEEMEAITPVDVLRRVDIPAYLVSTIPGEKTVTGAHGIKITADLCFEEADFDACNMIILPGGLPGATNLGAHEELCGKIKAFAAAGEEGGKYVAAICAAPMVLGALGVLEGKMATIYPGMEEELKGAIPMKNRVVVDGNIITSKGPGTAMEFAVEIAGVLKDKLTMATLTFDLIMPKGLR